jgi:predicted RNA methylase
MARSPRTERPTDRSDRALGIRTSRCIAAKALDLEGPHRGDAEDYQPTPPEVVDDLFVDLDVDFERYTFVDLGAGKGRVLCLASAWPFARVMGVELAPSLVRQARENVDAFDAPWRRARDLEIRQGDAATFVFPRTPLVVYLYNPFGARVLRTVLDNLERSLEANPRDAVLLYFEPVHDAVVRERWWIEPEHAAPRWTRYRTAMPR